MTNEECLEKAKNEHRARIFYNWWGNANINNRQWTLLDPDGELCDYHNQPHLINTCIAYGWKYQVERHHKKKRGEVTIIEEN